MKMNRKKAALFLIILFLNLISLYFGFLFIARDFDLDFLKIDHCLDSGGAWNYENVNVKPNKMHCR